MPFTHPISEIYRIWCKANYIGGRSNYPGGKNNPGSGGEIFVGNNLADKLNAGSGNLKMFFTFHIFFISC